MRGLLNRRKHRRQSLDQHTTHGSPIGVRRERMAQCGEGATPRMRGRRERQRVPDETTEQRAAAAETYKLAIEPREHHFHHFEPHLLCWEWRWSLRYGGEIHHATYVIGRSTAWDTRASFQFGANIRLQYPLGCCKGRLKLWNQHWRDRKLFGSAR